MKYKAKLLRNTEAYAANEILRNTTNTISLKSLINFWRLLEMPLINWKVELKLKCKNHSVLSANDNYNDDANFINIIFTIKNTTSQHYMTLSSLYWQKASKTY